MLISPYKGSDTMDVISSMRKQVNRDLPDDVKLMVSDTGKMWCYTWYRYRCDTGTCFDVKDKTVFHHEHDIVYYTKCPEVLVHMIMKVNQVKEC